MNIQAKKILVTGGAGFIASHIVDAYVAKGYDVAVVDNLSTGNKKNIAKGVKFYNADIRDLDAMKRIFKKERPQIVNHHAAVAEVTKSVKDPIDTIDNNVIGTTNVLVAAGEAGVKRFIFASTGGALYGEPKELPAHEDMPLLPLSPYGLSKMLGEQCIQYYARIYGFDYFIFRYANIYGPRQRVGGEAGVVPTFTHLMRNDQDPIIFGDGTKTRDYVHAEDVARANVLALTKGKNDIVNIGTGIEITDQVVFDEIAGHMQFGRSASYAPLRKGEVYRISLHARRAKEVLGWESRIIFSQGVRKTVDSYLSAK